MKRLLLVLAAAVIFINTVVIPSVVSAEGVGSTSCGGGNGWCKP